MKWQVAPEHRDRFLKKQALRMVGHSSAPKLKPAATGDIYPKDIVPAAHNEDSERPSKLYYGPLLTRKKIAEESDKFMAELATDLTSGDRVRAAAANTKLAMLRLEHSANNLKKLSSSASRPQLVNSVGEDGESTIPRTRQKDQTNSRLPSKLSSNSLSGRQQPNFSALSKRELKFFLTATIPKDRSNDEVNRQRLLCALKGRPICPKYVGDRGNW